LVLQDSEGKKGNKMQTIYQENSNVGGKRLGLDRRVADNPIYKGIERRINGDRRKGTRKRTHPRFQVKDLTFVKLNSENKKDIGQLLDISKAGLSLRYFIDGEKSQNYSSLGIFLSGGDFIIDQISFRIVTDAVLNSNSPFSTIILKRYAVQFENLTPEQTAKLDYFLLNHTLGEA
jgi:hypothetical protein